MMKRIHQALLLVLLFSLSALAHATPQNVRDQFAAVSYSNNDGSLNWVNDWQDSQDVNPAAGLLQITGGELRLEGVSGTDPDITRTVDLSSAVGTVTFTYDDRTSNNLENSDRFSVAVASSPVGPFTTLQTYINDSSGSESFDITAFASATTTIRIRVDVNMIGGSEFAYFDDVDISYDDGVLVNPGTCVSSNAEAYYPLDSATADASGNGHNLQAGSVGFNTLDYVLGTASADFNGTSQQLQYSDGTFMNQAAANISVAFYIKPDLPLLGTQNLFDEGGGTNGLAIRLNGSNLEVAVREGGAASQQTLVTAFPAGGGWQHIAVVYANGNLELFVNGLSQGSLATGFGTLNAHSDAGGFGSRLGGGNAFGSGVDRYAGLMDNVSYYYTPLSAAQIVAMVNCGGTIDSPTISKAFSPALISAGDVTTLTFTLSNTNSFPLTGVSFTDPMPISMWLDSTTVAGTCSGFTLTSGSAGASIFTLGGGTIPANASCTVEVEVMSSVPGTHDNTSSGVSSNEAATGAASNTASLTVVDAANAVCTPGNLGSGAILASQGTGLYSINLTTGKAERITTRPFGINGLAVNPEQYLVYFNDNAGNNGTIYGYDLLTDTHFTVEANVASLGVSLPGGGLNSSGAAYNNGVIYQGVEQAQGTEDTVWRIVLSDDGRSARYAQFLTNLGTSHDFGDMVVSGDKLFDFDRGNPDAFRRYSMLDYSVEVTAIHTVSQGGAQRDGTTLWAVSNRIEVIDTNGVLQGSPITITSNGSTAWGSAYDAGNCVVTTSRIGDLVWNDENGDGIKDATEAGIAGVTLELRYDLNANGVIDGGDVLVGTTTTAADGSYYFDNLTPDDYLVTVTDTANVLGGASPTNGAATRLVSNLGFNEDRDTLDFGYQALIVIRGTVFEDNGAGAGTANNGVQDGSESGFENVQIELQNPGSGGTVVASTLTDASGNYTLSIPNSLAGTALDVVATTINGYLSIGEDVGSTGAVNVNTRDDTISFTPAASTTYTGVDFGDVPQNTFVPDNTGSVQPAQVVFYPHHFTAGSAGVVSFSTTDLPTPSGLSWQHVIFHDADCNGVLNGSEASGALTSSLTVGAGQVVCLINKVFAPSNAPFSAQYLVTITANFAYSGEIPDGLTAQHSVNDLTTLALGGLSLSKTVENLDAGGSGAVTSNNATPGQRLRYVVTYTNISAGDISDLIVRDSVPAFTALDAPVSCPGGLPNNLVSCVVAVPAAASNVIGYNGPIEWVFTGTLAAGQQGTVQFDVLIE